MRNTTWVDERPES